MGVLEFSFLEALVLVGGHPLPSQQSRVEDVCSHHCLILGKCLCLGFLLQNVEVITELVPEAVERINGVPISKASQLAHSTGGIGCRCFIKGRILKQSPRCSRFLRWRGTRAEPHVCFLPARLPVAYSSSSHTSVCPRIPPGCLQKMQTSEPLPGLGFKRSGWSSGIYIFNTYPQGNIV